MAILIGQCDECGRVLNLMTDYAYDTDNGLKCADCYNEQPGKQSLLEIQNVFISTMNLVIKQLKEINANTIDEYESIDPDELQHLDELNKEWKKAWGKVIK